MLVRGILHMSCFARRLKILLHDFIRFLIRTTQLNNPNSIAILSVVRSLRIELFITCQLIGDLGYWEGKIDPRFLNTFLVQLQYC